MALLHEHKGEWLIFDFEDEEAIHVMDVDMVGPLIRIFHRGQSSFGLLSCILHIMI